MSLLLAVYLNYAKVADFEFWYKIRLQRFKQRNY